MHWEDSSQLGNTSRDPWNRYPDQFQVFDVGEGGLMALSGCTAADFCLFVHPGNATAPKSHMPFATKSPVVSSVNTRASLPRLGPVDFHNWTTGAGHEFFLGTPLHIWATT